MNKILNDIYKKKTNTLGKKYDFDKYNLIFQDENYKVYVENFSIYEPQINKVFTAQLIPIIH